MNSSKDNVLIVAGEASSATYAQRLLQRWKSERRSFHAYGVGSRDMEGEGFECIGRSEDLAVVGITEVVKSFSKIKNAFDGIIERAKKDKPKFALLLDLPDFNLRLAKKLKALNIPIIYYISPQLWAWREGRIKIIKKCIDHVLVILPFEEEFYRKHGMPATFVGHPLLDEIRPELFDEKHREMERSRYGIKPDEVVLGLMPGSRRSEIEHHLSLELEIAKQLKQDIPNLKVMLLVAPTLDMESLKTKAGAKVSGLGYPLIFLKKDPFDMISLPDVILAVSGTATLMVGLMRKPMAIIYRASALTAWIGRRLVKPMKYFGLSNIILDRMQSKEFLQEAVTVSNLVAELKPLLLDRSLRRKHENDLSELSSKLGDKGATERVAKFLEPYWK